MSQHIYNLQKDPPDQRDAVMMTPMVPGVVLPKSVDLRPKCPPIYDQGQLGSCTANAIGAALDTLHGATDGGVFFMPSRLFIYFGERDMEGTIDQDAGACIRDGIKFVNRDGACKETTWPYDISKFTLRPTEAAYAEAQNYQAVSYKRVPLVPLMFKSVLASGYPVVLGISVYSSFESEAVASTGVVPMPDVRNEQLLGGHAVCVVGYDDDKKAFLVRNSWGAQWGYVGHFWLPYAFVANPNLSSDAWAILKAE